MGGVKGPTRSVPSLVDLIIGKGVHTCVWEERIFSRAGNRFSSDRESLLVQRENLDHGGSWVWVSLFTQG